MGFKGHFKIADSVVLIDENIEYYECEEADLKAERVESEMSAAYPDRWENLVRGASERGWEITDGIFWVDREVISLEHPEIQEYLRGSRYVDLNRLLDQIEKEANFISHAENVERACRRIREQQQLRMQRRRAQFEGECIFEMLTSA